MGNLNIPNLETVRKAGGTFTGIMAGTTTAQLSLGKPGSESILHVEGPFKDPFVGLPVSFNQNFQTTGPAVIDQGAWLGLGAPVDSSGNQWIMAAIGGVKANSVVPNGAGAMELRSNSGAFAIMFPWAKATFNLAIINPDRNIFQDFAIYGASAGVTNLLYADVNEHRIFCDGFFGHGESENLEIQSGVVTASKNFITVDSNGATGNDDLETIDGFNEGDFVVVQSLDTDRNVTVRAGLGNLTMNGNFTLNNPADKLSFVMHNDGTLHEVYRKSNGG